MAESAGDAMNHHIRQTSDGLAFLKTFIPNVVSLAFFDPQYREVMDHLKYGNEGARQKGRALLPQMSTEVVIDFITNIERVLKPQGHLMLWIDKFILCNELPRLLADTGLRRVDLLTWHKDRMGMGYRTRRTCEYLLILQKPPTRVKGVWMDHGIPDVWTEKVSRVGHPHQKPILLQRRLIEAVTRPHDMVIDPACGSGSVMKACIAAGRDFIGTDLNPET